MNKKKIGIVISFLLLSVCFSGCNEQKQSNIRIINKPLFKIAIDFEEVDNRFQKTEEVYKTNNINLSILDKKNIEILELYSANFSGTSNLMYEVLLRFKNKEQGHQAYNSIKQNYSYDFPEIDGEKYGEESYIGKKTKLLFGSYIDLYLLVIRFENIVVFLSGITNFQYEFHQYAGLIENNLKESVLTIESEKEDFKILSNKYSMIQIDSDVSKGTVPLSISFDIDLIGREKISDSFYWYFDDGNTSMDEKTTNTFTKPGIYEVVLIVPNDQGIFYKDSLTIVAEEPPIFKFTSWEITDNYGFAGISINCNIRKPVDLKVQNPDNKITGIRYGIGKEIHTVNINLVNDLYETPFPGVYSLIVEESSSSKLVFQKDFSFQGSEIILINLTSFVWTRYQYWGDYDILESFYITIENSGDLPVYPYQIKCIIDDEIESTAFLETGTDKALFPGETMDEIYCYCYSACQTYEHSTVHVLNITLQDYYGNDISQSLKIRSYL